jgi:hypothetical protein
MSVSKRSRPSPAMIVAALALVLAMAGTAIAGPGAVDKITKSKVRSIADKEINKKAPGLSVDNAAKLGGQPASAFAASSAVRFVSIAANGTIEAARSQGVSQANVTTNGAGNYCINGLNPAPRNAQASLPFNGTPFNAQVYVQFGPTGPCAGAQVWISTFTPGNVPTNMPVLVALFN